MPNAATGKAKVDRLVMGLINPYRDYMRPWINGTPDHNIQHDPAFEWLFEVDTSSGGYNPWLAKTAEMAKDGRSWRITLQKGVQFHHGYGEFTARDVVHNHGVWCDPNYPGRKDPTIVGYKNGMCAVEKIEVINPHELVILQGRVPRPAVLLLERLEHDHVQQGAVGQGRGDGVRDPPRRHRALHLQGAPARTHVLYERAPTRHWKWGVVDWKEIKMTWNVEEPPRFAQLLAGESHIAEINRDLRDAIARGFKLIPSRQVAQQTVIAFGGLYLGTEDKATKRFTEYGGITGRFDPKVPWTNKKVRQAMNKAINRDEVLKMMYKGRATPTYVAGFSRSAGWTRPGRSASRRCTATTRRRRSSSWRRRDIRRASRRRRGCSRSPARRSFPR